MHQALLPLLWGKGKVQESCNSWCGQEMHKLINCKKQVNARVLVKLLYEKLSAKWREACHVGLEQGRNKGPTEEVNGEKMDANNKI